MKPIAVVTLAALLLYTFPVFPQDMMVIPKWTKMECGGVVHACYTFDEAKEMAVLDVDLNLDIQKLEVCQSIRDTVIKSNKMLKAALDLSGENEKALTLRLADKHRVLVKTTRDLAAKQEPIFGSGFPYFLVGAAAAVLTAFISGYLVARDVKT